MSRLAGSTWPEVARGTTVLVPVGSTEQHGPHLPMDTDTAIATATASGVVARRAGLLVAPAIAYGSSGEHQSFAGTVSIGAEALRLVLVEAVRSLTTWAGRVLFVNAHGGNVPALVDAVLLLRREGHEVAWAACATEELDLHAGWTETSLMLHLRPAEVHLDRAEAGDTRPLEQILPAMMAGGVAAVSPNGVLGDPAGADATHGRRLLEELVDDDVDARVERWQPDERGFLARE